MEHRYSQKARYAAGGEQAAREYLLYLIIVFMLPNNINFPMSDVIST